MTREHMELVKQRNNIYDSSHRDAMAGSETEPRSEKAKLDFKFELIYTHHNSIMMQSTCQTINTLHPCSQPQRVIKSQALGENYFGKVEYIKYEKVYMRKKKGISADSVW